MKKGPQQLILGPPGCGKTTFLLNKVEEMMAKGIPPRRIAYVSFTRKAASEAAERAVEKFSLQRSEFPFFRTLHSLAYQELGLSRQQVMSAKDYKNIGKALGLVFSDYMDFEEGIPVGAQSGDQVLYIVSMARATLRTPEQQFQVYMAGEVSWWQVKQFNDTLVGFKKDTGMVDFSDMLDNYVTGCEPLDIDVAFIDEAQDLSKQQWRMVRHAVSRAKQVFIAGDDDQAIYRWSGADVDSFLELEGKKTVLQQSYRLPRAVYSLCTQIAHRIGRRYEKVWYPREEQGAVTHLANLHDIQWQEGSYLFLARNRYLLDRFEQYVHQAGIPYSIGNRSSVNEDSVRAIIGWSKLQRGDQLPASECKIIYSKMRARSGVRHGFKSLPGARDDDMLGMAELKAHYGLLRDDIWHEALEMIPAEEREFYLSALRRKEKLSTKPRVHISTIHGVKGGEADHVVLMSDMAARTYNDYRNAPDDEHRVAYVGASRARQSLSILMAQGARAYPYL